MTDMPKTDVLMPKLGLTMTEATLSEWHKREGDTVAAGDVLFVFETDKSTLEFESPAAGVLSRILVRAGDTVPVYTPVAVIEAAQVAASVGENVRATQGTSRVRATPRARRTARELTIDLAAVSGSGPLGRIHEADVRRFAAHTAPEMPGPVPMSATPLARRVATANQVDLSAISGSGRDGRITRADVAARLDTPPAPADGGIVAPFTPVRAVTARRMAESATIPQVTLFLEADATELVAARTQINNLNARGDGAKVSYNALLVAMCARALVEMPALNVTFTPDGLRLHPHAHIGVATDTERGLLVPVVPETERLSLARISATLNERITRAVAGKARPEDLEGATFTITNLGMFDIEGFTPLLTPPQVAILGVGKIVQKVVPHNGQIAIRDRLTLSLTFDHRAVDGAPAARFLQTVKDMVENPYLLLMGTA